MQCVKPETMDEQNQITEEPFFIDQTMIYELLEQAEQNQDPQSIDAILDKADAMQGLTPEEVAVLLKCDHSYDERMFSIARKIKQEIYGNRIVIFAPLYVSDYCVNECAYCSYNCNHKFKRSRLTQEELRKELQVLEQMGHKRLALEAGEDDENCSIEYVLSCIDTIYKEKMSNGEIRRVNVNIAATTVENYQKLHDAGIGTYILFQETYHQPSYEKMHISGPKRDYRYHTTAFDRAMEAGIDDVGAGVLFGLYDSDFEVLALMLHNLHLEEKFGVGFHTVSVPRIRPAQGATCTPSNHAVDDDTFERIVAIIRLAIPFTGMILSTRESEEMRARLLEIGISQISAGSSTGVGGYARAEETAAQFEVSDERDAQDVLKWLLKAGYIPSFCTACYRNGRTGDRFMRLAKSGQIKNVCLPNALMTLQEYSQDYGDEEFKQEAEKQIGKSLQDIRSKSMQDKTAVNVKKIRDDGARDLFV